MTEPSELVVRAAALYLPVALVVAFAVHGRPSRSRIAGALLATAWNLAALLAVNVVAVRAGWWSFGSDIPTADVAGVPVELWVGWALLWGAVPILATITRLTVAAALLVAIDLVLMPLAEPVVLLDPTWPFGEAVAVAFGLVPGLLLGRWTAAGERLGGRVVLQVVAFTGLLFYVLPSLVFTIVDAGWGPLLDRPRWQFAVAAVVLAPIGAMALQAVGEFADHGGTPVPLDPPAVLVVTGPYAYVANPMQLAATILLAAWGVLLASPGLVAAAVGGAVFSAGLAAWNEHGELSRRFGDDWHRYRSQVRLWVPRWRPAVARPAVVYAAETCEPCSEVGRFLRGRRASELEVVPAERCPDPLQRVTYERDARRSEGLAAIGRSLEHVNLAWAGLSWIVRLPIVGPVLQLIADAVGGGPARSIDPSRPAEAGTDPDRPGVE